MAVGVHRVDGPVVDAQCDAHVAQGVGLAGDDADLGQAVVHRHEDLLVHLRRGALRRLDHRHERALVAQQHAHYAAGGEAVGALLGAGVGVGLLVPVPYNVRRTLPLLLRQQLGHDQVAVDGSVAVRLSQGACEQGSSQRRGGCVRVLR